MLQNLMQAYTQSKTKLHCIVICYLLVKLKKKYFKDTVLHVAKPLYGLTKAENHWFATYLDQHREKLGIKMSLYDACFLINKNGSENFGIAKL